MIDIHVYTNQICYAGRCIPNKMIRLAYHYDLRNMHSHYLYITLMPHSDINDMQRYNSNKNDLSYLSKLLSYSYVQIPADKFTSKIVIIISISKDSIT